MQSSDHHKHNHVVLLHGVLCHSMQMHGLARHLKKNQFIPININYPSRDMDLGSLATWIQAEIRERIPEGARIHFVGFSMGGLLVRVLIHQFRPKNLGRAVLLGSPNKGSEVADFLQKNPLYKWLYGPAGQQLITNQSDFQHVFGPVNYELGIIAGNFHLDPLATWVMPGPSDGKVSVESTKLEGMKEHLVVRSNHLLFPWHPHIQMQTTHFLTHGHFKSTD